MAFQELALIAGLYQTIIQKVNDRFINHLAADRLFGYIHGDIQSGKSSVQICVSLHDLMFKRRTTIWILRNNCGDELQAFSGIRSECENLGLQMPQVSSVRDMTIEQLAETMRVDTHNPGIVVCLANVTQLGKVRDASELLQEDERNYNVMIDEVDVLYESDAGRIRAQRSEPLNAIKNNAKSVLGVSATAFGVLFSETNLYAPAVYVLSRHENYIGIGNFRWLDIDSDLPVTQVDRRNIPLEYMQRLLDLHPTGYMPTANDGTEFYHPVILLSKTSRFREVFNDIVRESPDTWCALSYDGEGVVIKCRDTMLLQMAPDSITVRRKSDGSRVTSIRDSENGLFHFKKVQIGDVLEALRLMTVTKMRLDEPGHITHIVIASGALADRGINFVSNNYTANVRQWHLTDMVYIPTKESSCSDHIQAMRPCGIFNDNIRPLIATSALIKQDILRANEQMQATIINECGLRSVDWNCRVFDLVREIPFREEQIPRNSKISKVKVNLNIVPEQQPETEPVENNEDDDLVNYTLRNTLRGASELAIYNEMCAILSRPENANRWIRRSNIIAEMKETLGKSDSSITGQHTQFAFIQENKFRSVPLNEMRNAGLYSRRNNRYIEVFYIV